MTHITLELEEEIASKNKEEDNNINEYVEDEVSGNEEDINSETVLNSKYASEIEEIFDYINLKEYFKIIKN